MCYNPSMPRILMGIFAAGILIGMSYLTARAYSAGFRFNGMQTKIGFLAFLLVPLTFMGSLLMTRSTTLGSPLLYTIIQIIAGAGFYVFVSAILLALALGIATLFSTTPPLWTTWAALAFALSCITIGLIQSRMVTVRDYTVTLSGAPDSWNGKTAVLVSDTHLGLVNYTKFSDKVVTRILAERPDFVLHAGDFYDGPTVDTTPITASWQRLAGQIPVFYAPGNHEGYGNYSAFVDSVRNAGITGLDDKKVDYDGIQIAGITYRSGKESPAAAAAIASLSLDSSRPSILINHPPTSLAAAAAAGIDLQVSGHTHNGQFWPMNYLIKKIYGRFAHGMAKYSDMTVITSSGIGTFGPPYRLFNTPELVRITFRTQ